MRSKGENPGERVRPQAKGGRKNAVENLRMSAVAAKPIPARVPIKQNSQLGVFVFSAIRERTLEKGFDHKRKADFRAPVSLANVDVG